MLKFCFDVLIYEVRWQRSETKHQSKSFILLHFDADLIRLCFFIGPVRHWDLLRHAKPIATDVNIKEN